MSRHTSGSERTPVDKKQSLSAKRVAVVYDYLPEAGGGAERVLTDILKAFSPHCNLFLGAVVDSAWSKNYLSTIRRVYPDVTIHIGREIRNFKSIHFRKFHYSLVNELQKFKFDNYDIILCYTSFLAHTVICPPHAKKIIYMNTPARMLWNLPHSASRVKTLIPEWLFSIPKATIRLHDISYLHDAYKVATISEVSKKRIYSFYNRDATVIYPAVSIHNLEKNSVKHSASLDKKHFVHVSRIESYKNIQLLVDAVALSKENSFMNDTQFFVIGHGPYFSELLSYTEKKLEETSRKVFLQGIGEVLQVGKIIFTGHITEELKIHLVKNAIASLALNDEDFGLTKVESLLLGVPVVGLAAGATPEIIKTTDLGILFSENTPEALREALESITHASFDTEKLLAAGREFSFENFSNNLKSLIA